MPGISIGTSAPATTNGFQKDWVHGWKLFAFKFFQHLAACVRTVRQFAHEHLGKTFLADLELFQLVVNLGCDCECDSSHTLIIHGQCTKATRNPSMSKIKKFPDLHVGTEADQETVLLEG